MRAFTRFCTKVADRFLPDAYLFAIILTALTYILCLIFTDAGPVGTLKAMGGGMWNLLAFTAEMATIMVFGYAFAKTKAIETVLTKLSNIPKTPAAAYFFTAFVASICCWVCWAAGLIMSAFIAKKIAAKVKGVHYPLIVAAAYAGFLVFQLGFTGSVSLLVATPGNFMEEQIGGLIPISQTMTSPYNLFLSVILGLVVIPLMMRASRPAKGDVVIELDPAIVRAEEEERMKEEKEKVSLKGLAPNAWMENNYFFNLLISVGFGIYLIYHFVFNHGSLTIDITNLIFMIAGLLLTPTPIKYVKNCIEGASTVGGVIMQFPLYAAIQGMMLQTGLAQVIADAFVSISTARTLPMWTFFSAGVLNMFIPSGGSQFSVQGPIMIEAAKGLHADFARTCMAVAYGDNWTNLIQPFWALPLLAVANLRAKDIMGYLTPVLIITGIVFCIVLVGWPA
ncbi:MAG: short-chain fatty acid transporter [Eubacterium sp.]|nr:short-chain fatty acid transporter [Eubacterium sp.]